MLQMMSLKDRARLVFSTDDAVKLKKKGDDPQVLRFEDCTFLDGKKPVVFTVRLLNSRERMQVAESATISQSAALWAASEKAICKIEGPGVRAVQADEISDLLLQFDPSVIYTLAGWIVEQTSLKKDPLGAQK